MVAEGQLLPDGTGGTWESLEFLWAQGASVLGKFGVNGGGFIPLWAAPLIS